MINQHSSSLFSMVICVLASYGVYGDNHSSVHPLLDADEIIEQDMLSYPATYFERFQPITALDMVNQIPGFHLADGASNIRGFGGAAGNVLIDDRRPSAKSDSLSAMLARIPAASVERIELIRGQVRGIDLGGQSAVANLVLRAGIPAMIQWEASIRQTFEHGPLKPEARLSLSDTWKGVDYNIGLDARRFSVGRKGIDEIYDGNNTLVEQRFDKRDNRNTNIKANLNASSWWGDTFLRLNSVFSYDDFHNYTNSDRLSNATGFTRNSFFDDFDKVPSFEIGADLERSLNADIIGRAVLLYVQSDRDISKSQRERDSEGNQTLYREALGDRKTTEAITRLEFDWIGSPEHIVQLNLERAFNVLDNRLNQTDDIGSGPVFVNIPGANTRVEEVRWDALLKDTWLPGPFELDYGIGAEVSTISQSGDATQKRNFFFIKPQTGLSYSHANNDQTRIRLNREVAQLNLMDFVSGTVFQDDDLALGNPDIQPDTTWKLEINHEKRISSGTVIKLTAFHHWISDVIDLLPLNSSFEVPGNIGDGRRWGLLFESTLPLDQVGLRSARLNIKARWQDSSVTDPVTGDKRVLSISSISGGAIVFDIENRYALDIDYRQDFQEQQFAWGWRIMERAKQYQFKVDELLVYDEGIDIRAFIETTRWFGIKIQYGIENILNFNDNRKRTMYSGERGLSMISSTELRERTRGIRMYITLGGNF